LLIFDGALWPQLDETTLKLLDDNAVVIVNKADLIDEKKHTAHGAKRGPLLFVSAKTGHGISGLLTRLVAAIKAPFADNIAPALTRERHRAALEECQGHLCRALAAGAAELRAEDMRLAARALGRITGRVDVEDLLDVIFRDFCLGK
jgi:tRNA modification GTPase